MGPSALPQALGANTSCGQDRPQSSHVAHSYTPWCRNPTPPHRGSSQGRPPWGAPRGRSRGDSRAARGGGGSRWRHALDSSRQRSRPLLGRPQLRAPEPGTILASMSSGERVSARGLCLLSFLTAWSPEVLPHPSHGVQAWNCPSCPPLPTLLSSLMCISISF